MPAPTHLPLLTESYLSGLWSTDFTRYLAEEDAAARECLGGWPRRLAAKETTDEMSFLRGKKLLDPSLPIMSETEGRR